MRIALASLLLLTALAGCTIGSDDPAADFEASCPNWTQSPGHPGAQLQFAGYYRNDRGEPVAANEAGENVHSPTLLKAEPYEWDGLLLDVYEWDLAANTHNGSLEFKVWAAEPDIKLQTDADGNTYWDEDDKVRRLLFRDLSLPAGAQYIDAVIIPSGTMDFSHSYRIELAQPPVEPEPLAIWIEYRFIDDDGSYDTPSGANYQSRLNLWYRDVNCGQ